jgi:hypothetical protein
MSRWVKDRRGLLRTALGYAHRQRGPLTRFFDDGRLRLTNNQSERELRRIATSRHAWLFVGSDDHGQAAGNLLSLVASARLHLARGFWDGFLMDDLCIRVKI